MPLETWKHKTETSNNRTNDLLLIKMFVTLTPVFGIEQDRFNLSSLRLRSHRSRLFGYTVYVFEGTRILEIKHYEFLIPDHIGGHYSKSSYRRV